MTEAKVVSQRGITAGEDGISGDASPGTGAHRRKLGTLIALLEKAQVKHGYLPEAVLRAIAEDTGHSLVDVYGVATFYKSFSLQPKGKHTVCTCLGTACHVRGARRIVEEFERQLGIKAGETTGDREFTLETVNCLGACALGPVAVVDGHYFSKVKTSQVRQLLERAAEGFEGDEVGKKDRVFPLTLSCPRCNHSLMDDASPIDGYPSVRMTISHDRRHGWVRLSSLYGSQNVLSEHEIPTGSEATFFCPHCHAELNDTSNCTTCGASMVTMIVQGGGTVLICSRRGCNSHRLDLL